MSDKAGTKLAEIQEEWGEEFSDLDMADDWALLEDEMTHQSRWCTHWVKWLKHDDGMVIGIEYARDVGDGDSAAAYPTEWFEGESYAETVTKYRRKTS